MPLVGDAVIAIWNDIAAEGRENFDEWHPREHMPERLSIPGFLRGRRYAAIEAQIAYFTFYEARDMGVLTGPDYKARLNSPTDWSRETVQAFRNNLRGVARIAFSRGHADGAYLSTIRLEPVVGREAALQAHLADALARLIDRHGVTGAHLCLCDPDLSGTNTKLQRERKIGVPGWIVLIEGISVEAVRSASATVSETELLHQGARPGPIRELFGLEYGISKIADAARA